LKFWHTLLIDNMLETNLNFWVNREKSALSGMIEPTSAPKHRDSRHMSLLVLYLQFFVIITNTREGARCINTRVLFRLHAFADKSSIHTFFMASNSLVYRIFRLSLKYHGEYIRLLIMLNAKTL